MQISTFRRVYALSAVLCSCIAGCGGGGGGDKKPATPEPAGPPAGTGLALTPNNYFNAGSLTLSLADMADALAVKAARAFRDLLERPDTGPVERGCFGNGVARATISIDADGTASVSPGDRIQIAHEACRTIDPITNTLKSEMLGTILIDVTQIDYEPGKTRALLHVTFGAHSMFPTQFWGPSVVTYGGSLEVDFEFTDTEDRFRITSAQFDAAVGAAETDIMKLRQFSSDFTHRYDTFTRRLTLAGEVTAARLDMQYQNRIVKLTFDTPVPLHGPLFLAPGGSAGAFALRGSDNTAARFELVAEGNTSSLRAGPDINNDGVPEQTTSGNWNAFLATQFDIQPFRDGATRPDLPLPPPSPPEGAIMLKSRAIALGAEGRAIALDPARARLYVSVPDRNEVVVLSSDTFQVQSRIFVGAGPRDLLLSRDGRKLYTANYAGGSVGVLNLDAGNALGFIDLGAALGTGIAHLAESASGLLFVSSDQWIPPKSNLASIDLNAGNAVQWQAGNLHITPAPALNISPDGASLHAGNSAYRARFSASDPSMNLLQSDGTFSASGEQHFNFDADGSHLISSSGRLYRTGTLAQDGQLPIGFPSRFSNDKSRLWVASHATSIWTLDGGTYQEKERYTSDCPHGVLRDFRQANSRGDWVFISGNTLCAVSPGNPAQPPGADGGLPPPAAPGATDAAGSSVRLGGAGLDVAMDDARQLAYVSVPSRDEIVIVDLAASVVAARIPIPAHPAGIDLNHDRSILYVALSQSSRIALIDTLTRTIVQTIDLTAALNHGHAHDVLEVSPGRVFVTADFNPTYGYPSLAELRRDQGDASRGIQVASSLSSRSKLAISPDRQALYVSDGFGTTSPMVRRVDLARPGLPTVAESDRGALAGFDWMQVGADGGRVFLSSGQILDSATLRPVGRIDAGQSFPARHGARVMVARPYRKLARYDSGNFQLTDTFNTTCKMTYITRLQPNAAETRWVVLGNDVLCSVSF